MDEEYAMQYTPVIYNWWRHATPAQRAITNDTIRSLREKHQRGQTENQLVAWARAQPGGMQHPPAFVRSLVKLAVMMPHVPRIGEYPKARRAY